MEAATSAPEARRFGKYTLVAKLATGGMAEIFLARLHGDGGFEKLVCIKRILPHLVNDPLFVALFLDEARVAARISHPNVCQVFELGEWQGQYYIAMEYLEGVPLSVFRRKDFYQRLPDPRLVAGFGVQACEGLHHAHQLKNADGELLGVVHRDVSPQNLFATTDGVVKVLDFGIAKVQDASARTSTGAVKGTYAYMAPEQLRNDTLDRRVDVWAMGVVLWETLAQRHLFKRETEFLTFEAITKLPIPDLSEVRPDVPPLLADTVARALSRNRDDRFASARALGEALAQAVAPLGGAATGATISDEVSRSFEATLAEQRMLLRIAREGGQFDLGKPSELVGHGAVLTTTPASSLQRRIEEAQAEVAQYVAASQAIDSLYEDEGMKSRPYRFGTDGAFTPAPSRRTGPVSSEAEPDSGIVIAPAPQSPADLESSPYAVAEWHSDDTEVPLPVSRRSAPTPLAPAPKSKLPWAIAIVAIVAIGTAAVMLYMEQKAMKTATAAEQREPVVMTSEPAAPAPPPAAEPQPAVQDDAADDTDDDTAENGSATDEEDAHVAVVEPKKRERRSDRKSRVDKSDRDDDKRRERRKSDRDDDKKRESRRSSKEERDDKTPAAEKAVSGAPGFITIDSTPVYAMIYIDGKKYGETPLVNIKLAPGKHSVRAVSPSGSTRNLTIQIEAGKTAPVRRIEW